MAKSRISTLLRARPPPEVPYNGRWHHSGHPLLWLLRVSPSKFQTSSPTSWWTSSEPPFWKYYVKLLLHSVMGFDLTLCTLPCTLHSCFHRSQLPFQAPCEVASPCAHTGGAYKRQTCQKEAQMWPTPTFKCYHLGAHNQWGGLWWLDAV